MEFCTYTGISYLEFHGSVMQFHSQHMYHGRSKESGQQWSFEGVQVGGIGSIVGVIGIWRGANTMGFWWQWKVA